MMITSSPEAWIHMCVSTVVSLCGALGGAGIGGKRRERNHALAQAEEDCQGRYEGSFHFVDWASARNDRPLN